MRLNIPNMFREARVGGRGKNWFLELLIFVPVFVIASTLQSIPVSIGQGVYMAQNPRIMEELMDAAQTMDLGRITAVVTGMMTGMPDWYNILSLFCTGIATVVAILFCRWLQKRALPSLGFRRGHAVREYLVGAILAVLMISAAVLIGVLTGAYRISAGSVSFGTIVLYLVGYLIQGMSEETLCRGYLMVSLARKNPVWLSVLLSSLVFAALHLANPGLTLLAFLNLVLFGVLMSVYVIRRGNLWGACALHSVWNFFQGHVYGISVSGTGVRASFLTTSAVGSPLWSGGAFGAEGGLGVTVVLAAVICLMLFIVPEKKDEFSPAPVPAAE